MGKESSPLRYFDLDRAKAEEISPPLIPDYGYTVEDVADADRLIALLSKDPDITTDDLGKIMGAVQRQIPHALRRSELEELKGENSQDRNFMARFWNWLNSPAETREQKLAYERDQTLGVISTPPSSSGWRVRYPDRKWQKYEYEEDRREASNIVIASQNQFFRLPVGKPPLWSKDPYATGMRLDDYRRSDGVLAPRLRIQLPTTNPLESAWILREGNSVEEDCDPRVLLFEKAESASILVTITRLYTATPTFEIKRMEVKHHALTP